MKFHCILIVMLLVTVVSAQNAEKPAEPTPSTEKTLSSAQEPAASVQDPAVKGEPQRVTLPPEVWQALLRQSQTQMPIPTVGFPRLGPAGRSLLALLAVAVVVIGFIAARQLGRPGGLLVQGYAVWFLLGLFGAIAGLLVAAAATGSLYLHVSGAVCTVLSGFSILGWLTPQWGPLRRWVRGESKSQLHKEIRHAGDAENANA